MIRALLIIGGVAAAAYFLGARRPAQGPGRAPADATEGIPNDVLAERVRTLLRGLLKRPEAVHVLANAGAVTLEGTLPRRERDRVLAEVLAVPGVTGIVNHIEASEPPGTLAAP